MKDIIKEIEYCSAKIKEVKAATNAKNYDEMNLLVWKLHEYRRGMIKACRLLGVKVQAGDLEGLKWGVTGVAE